MARLPKKRGAEEQGPPFSFRLLDGADLVSPRRT